MVLRSKQELAQSYQNLKGSMSQAVGTQSRVLPYIRMLRMLNRRDQVEIGISVSQRDQPASHPSRRAVNRQPHEFHESVLWCCVGV